MRLQAAKRWKGTGGHVPSLELPQALRPDVLQAVSPEIDEPQPRRRLAVHGSTRRLRDKNLAPVAGVGDPRGNVHVEPEIVLAHTHRLAGVKPDPDTQRIGGAVLRGGRSLD